MYTTNPDWIPLANNASRDELCESYTDEQIKLIDVYDGFAKKSPYMFHTTLPNNILSIQKEGLVAGKKPRFEGVSSSDKISLAANEEIAKYYGEEADVLLRVKKGYIFKDLEIDLLGGGDGAYTTGKNIPPDALEVKDGKKWVPLKDYKPTKQTTPSKEQAKEVVSEEVKQETPKKEVVKKQDIETKVKELTEKRDVEIVKASKPSLKLDWVSVKDIAQLPSEISKDKKEEQAKIKTKYKELLKIMDCL
jgi:hypothetical protein